MSQQVSVAVQERGVAVVCVELAPETESLAEKESERDVVGRDPVVVATCDCDRELETVWDRVRLPAADNDGHESVGLAVVVRVGEAVDDGVAVGIESVGGKQRYV